MFENVPEWLVEMVSGLQDQIDPSDRHQIYYKASGWTIAWYLRKNVGAPDADPFFIPQEHDLSKPADSDWNAHVNRTELIAETLFILRNSPGFEEMRSRLEKRDLRPSFFEMLTAKQFFKSGFQIEARPETGIKGEDFDFLARRGEETVHVEVTALEANQYSQQTVRNALFKKRRQLSADMPGVIYCVLPEWWFDSRVDLNAELDRITPEFLARTGRVNAVVYWGELRLDFGQGEIPGSSYGLIRVPYLNENARLPINLPFLFQGRRSEEVREVIATGVGAGALKNESYDSEYFRWIDSLVPLKADR